MGKRNCKKAYRKGYREAQEEIKDLLSDVKDDIKAIEFLVSTSSDVSLDTLLKRLMSIRKNISEFETEEYSVAPAYYYDEEPERRSKRVRTILDFNDEDNNDVADIDIDIDIETIGDELFDEFNRYR